MQSYKLSTKVLAVYYYKNKYTGLQGRRHRVVGAVAPPQNCTGLPNIYALCGLPNTYALSEQHHSFYLVNFLLWIPFGEFPFVNFLWRISFCEFPLVNSLWWIIPYGVSTPPPHTHTYHHCQHEPIQPTWLNPFSPPNFCDSEFCYQDQYIKRCFYRMTQKDIMSF